MEKDEKNSMNAVAAMQALCKTEIALINGADEFGDQAAAERKKRRHILEFLGFPDGDTFRFQDKHRQTELIKSKDGSEIMFYAKAFTPETKEAIDGIFNAVKLAGL